METQRYAAQNVLVAKNEILHNGVVTVAADGTIVSVNTITEAEAKKEGLPIRNGYLCAGFVNAHTHSELAFLEDLFLPGGSMAAFLRQIDALRLQFTPDEISAAQKRGYETFAREGIVAYADISNDASTAAFKKNELFRSITFVEMFGVNAALGEAAYRTGEQVLHEFREAGVEAYMTPHATYSVSEKLWTLLQPELEASPIFSLHYAETAQEIDFLKRRAGAIYNLFHIDWQRDVEAYGLQDIERILSHYGQMQKRILLVHGVCLTTDMLAFIHEAIPEATIVPCPESNLFIEGKLANYPALRASGVRIAVGTDSLSSSPSLSILRQLQVVNSYYPEIPIAELLEWATCNGADACGFNDLGSLTADTQPGLNWIEIPPNGRNSLAKASVHPIAHRNGFTENRA